MRNYWLKIVAGAFAIFAIGMALISGWRKVTVTLKSSDPILIPLIGLVPFRLDSTKVGSVNRVELLRTDPEHIAGIRVVISLADSVEPNRLRSCRLELDDLDQLNEKTTFRCHAEDSELAGLEPFGSVVVSGGHDTFPLLVPSRTARQWRETSVRFDHEGLHVNSPHDAVAERRDSLRDLLSERVDARSDSADDMKALASSLEDSAANLDVAGRRRVQRSADSVRAAMRAMVDRMKADESRMKALDGALGLSVTQLDSLAGMTAGLRDSIRRSVRRQLEQTRELQGKQPPRSQAELPPAAPPAPVAPVAKPR